MARSLSWAELVRNAGSDAWWELPGTQMRPLSREFFRHLALTAGDHAQALDAVWPRMGEHGKRLDDLVQRVCELEDALRAAVGIIRDLERTARTHQQATADEHARLRELERMVLGTRTFRT